MSRLRQTIALWACTLLPVAFAGGETSLTVTLEPPVIPFHKQATFTIAVEAPEDLEVLLPNMTETFGKLPLYGPPTRQTGPVGKHRTLYTERYVFSPTFIGDYVVAPVEIHVGGEILAVPSPAVRVRDLTPEETRDVLRFDSNAEPPPATRPFLSDWRFWLGLLATGAAAVAIYFYWRRVRTRAAEPVPTLTPWDAAYARLEELRARRWPKSGRFDPYYVELSDILRQYIEARLDLHAPEQTTPEFLAQASQTGVLSERRQQLLADFLRHSDRVKFARYEPSLEQMDKSFDTVRAFIRDTAPPSGPPIEGPAALGGAA